MIPLSWVVCATVVVPLLSEGTTNEVYLLGGSVYHSYDGIIGRSISFPHVSQVITGANFWVVKLLIFLLRASTWVANVVTSLTSIIPTGFTTYFPLEFYW